MKKIVMMVGVIAAALGALGDTWTDPETGIEWHYTIEDIGATIGYSSMDGGDVVAPTNLTITIPKQLGGFDVVYCNLSSFYCCTNLETLIIPSTVTSFSHSANTHGKPFGLNRLNSFVVEDGNPSLCVIGGALYGNNGKTLACIAPARKSVELYSNVEVIGHYAFHGCNKIGDVAIPASVNRIINNAFSSCSVTNIVFLGDAPIVGFSAFGLDTSTNLVLHAKSISGGWVQLAGVPLVFDDVEKTAVSLTVTNIVVHYIQTSEKSLMAAPISGDVGFVNVVTEIKGGKVSVPDSWATNYAGFEAKFGSDFGEALTAKSGKYDVANNPMFVWQDYVAGTDPTDEKDVFKASVTMVDGVPVISYTPQLSDTEKAKRKYTTWGKEKLQDEKWVEVPSGDEAKYNFFKVTVEMK